MCAASGVQHCAQPAEDQIPHGSSDMVDFSQGCALECVGSESRGQKGNENLLSADKGRAHKVGLLGA